MLCRYRSIRTPYRPMSLPLHTGSCRPIAPTGQYGLGLRLCAHCVARIRLRSCAMSLSLHTHTLSPYVATAPYGLLSPYCPNGAIRAWATAMCSLRCAHTPPLVCYVAIAPYAHFVALFGRHQPAIYAYTNLPRNSCKKSSFELKTLRFCVSKAAPRRLHPLHDAKFHVACDSNAPSIG